MEDRHKKIFGKILTALAVVIAVIAVAFGVYVGIYYHADDSVEEYLSSGGKSEEYLTSGVKVEARQTAYGWFLDGPSEENALIFYPGAKVDEKAYIPLLYRFSQEGMDVCLVKMPYHLAFFGMNKASDVMEQYEYENWYVGGHSLDGAMSANFAAAHGDGLSGVVLLAAYATEKLDDDLLEIVIYGSEDQVLRDGKIEEGRAFVPGQPGNYIEHVIEGGNHAQFGNYGEQKGDGKALISAQEQQEETVRIVMEAVGNDKE